MKPSIPGDEFQPFGAENEMSSAGLAVKPHPLVATAAKAAKIHAGRFTPTLLRIAGATFQLAGG
jgi:hypothetical protein